MARWSSALALATMALMVPMPPADARGFRGGGSFARFSGAAMGAYLRRPRLPEPSERRSAPDPDLPERSDIEGTPRVSTYSRSVLDAPAGRAGAGGPCAEMQALAAPPRPVQTREEWAAECGKVGTLAGSGMGFCVVNGH